MKQHLAFLKEVHHALLFGSSYLTVSACVASLVFVLLSINCGAPPQSQYHVPESAITAAERTTRPQSVQNSGASLPESATVQLAKMAYLRNAFKGVVRVSSRGGLNDFHASSRGKVQHSAIVSNCSFDVLKAFIANGWAPIVIVEFQGRTPEILPLTHYNEQLGEVLFEDPSNLNKRRLTYKDFERAQSRISGKKCVLITPQRLTEMDIQKVLGHYLPTEAFQQISVQSR